MNSIDHDRIINVCVVGAGRAGLIHAENFAGRVRGARLAAISEPDGQVAAAAIDSFASYGPVKWYKNHVDALTDRSIEAFIVVTPTKYHRDIVVDLALAGKHIFCEKPMALTEGECDDMISAAKKGGVVLQIGFMRRFDDCYLKAKEAVDSGAIGNVVMIRSNTRGPSVPQPWMYDLSISNGPLAEVNSHDIDTLRWFSGSEFSTIYAIGGNYRSPAAKTDYPDFYDNVVFTARMKNGVQCSIDGAQGVGYAYDARVEILGEKGCIFIGSVHGSSVMVCTADGNNTYYVSGDLTHLPIPGSEVLCGLISDGFVPEKSMQNKDKSNDSLPGDDHLIEASPPPTVKSWRRLFRGAYLAEATAFCGAVRSGAPPRVTGHDGKMAVAAVNAGNRSIRENKIITLL